MASELPRRAPHHRLVAERQQLAVEPGNPVVDVGQRDAAEVPAAQVQSAQIDTTEVDVDAKLQFLQNAEVDSRQVPA